MAEFKWAHPLLFLMLILFLKYKNMCFFWVKQFSVCCLKFRVLLMYLMYNKRFYYTNLSAQSLVWVIHPKGKFTCDALPVCC